MTASTTHFGYQDVPTEEKQGRVRDVFARVATNYDRMNDAMSLGIHRLWKQEFVRRLPLRPNLAMLDLAGGTGDIALRMLNRAGATPISLTLCDINPAMLAEGQARAIDANRPGLKFVCGNAQTLPFPDRSMDVVTIAFGIRNVTDIPAALREAYRVLKPGGLFACLEFSNVAAPLRGLYDAYSFAVVPRLGELIANDRDSYQYLVESIRRFPDRETFASMMREAGFARVHAEPLSAGIVAIHRGWRV